MNSLIAYIKSWIDGILSLLTGLKVTIINFVRPKVTECYPENRKTLHISERFKGRLTMPHNEDNEHKCTACGICQMNCPNGSIVISSNMVEVEGKKKKILDAYMYNLGQCTFCNLCVISCPSEAIEFSPEFENAVFTFSTLTSKLNRTGSRLQEKKKMATKV
ncbi:MAG: 4Fe-4S binding protein [Bacteroidales bacterium]|jgi:NADH-quinone oxidoreductase subunit I|nr:4Fe-4S binding protein [Bacteroidales bacterium]